MRYVSPIFKSDSFNCPWCNAFSQQVWDFKVINFNVYYNNYCLINESTQSSKDTETNNFETIAISTCQVCKKYHVWHNEKMLTPSETFIPLPITDMPKNVSDLYMEARDVFEKSPKSSCALLRLAVQVLCNELVADTRDLNIAIGKLVSKGLPIGVQQALDSIRVIGNNAVHPGEINIDDNKEIASSLFNILNIIVEKLIIEPQKINELFSMLPKGARNQIEKRDGIKK